MRELMIAWSTIMVLIGTGCQTAKSERSIEQAASSEAAAQRNTLENKSFSNSRGSKSFSNSRGSKSVSKPIVISDDDACRIICGSEYEFDHPGDLSDGAERICVYYPLRCGNRCTKSWKIESLVDGSYYSCHMAVQEPEPPLTFASDDEACKHYCGDVFDFDHLGKERNGEERICIFYPEYCGESCTKQWLVESFVDGSNYTCYTAIQEPDPPTEEEIAADNEGCKKICGKNFNFEFRGVLNDGDERICTYYPKGCGYNCTSMWKRRGLVNDTNYTCWTALEEDDF